MHLSKTRYIEHSFAAAIVCKISQNSKSFINLEWRFVNFIKDPLCKIQSDFVNNDLLTNLSMNFSKMLQYMDYSYVIIHSLIDIFSHFIIKVVIFKVTVTLMCVLASY